MTSPVLDRTHRPRYHFLPPEHWMNDPNGLIYWRGRYHMFYQFNPNGAFWGTMHWGHAVSSDLVHWEHLPIALAPSPDTVDAEGCFSGCAVDNNGTVMLIYSGHTTATFEAVCLATAQDAELITWQKYAGNPIIAAPPPDHDYIQFRDHTIWHEADGWYQAIGAGIRDVGGAVLLYRSQDLIAWEYLHPLAVGDLHQHAPVWTATMWECPLFLDLGTQHALLISAWNSGQTLHTVAMVGAYADHRFKPEQTYKFDYGDNYFYAPQSCIDAQGRIVLWGWLQEGRDTEAGKDAGWSGVMSLPRIITARADGLLNVAPAPELIALRGAQHALDAQTVVGEIVLDISGDCLELDVTIDPGNAARCGLVLRRAPDGSEATRIVYDQARGWIAIDSSQSSYDERATRDVRGGPLTLHDDEPLRLRVFVDHSVIEVFANERACLTGRVYPTRDDSVGIGIFAHGSAQLLALDAWPMHSIW